LAYLERYRRDNGVQDALDLSNFLGSVSYGEMDYAIEFSKARKEIFDRYLDSNVLPIDAITSAEDVEGLNEGDKKLLEALRATDALLDEDVRDALPYFIDYVIERVLLIDISVDSEAEAHRVFVTMNDRGLRLGPIDLLKGQILSKITSSQDNHSCHQSWIEMVNKLKAIDPEEDSLFFRHLFRAKWANTIRGKSKGDAAGDFDVIGDAYHRWFEEHSDRLGLINSDEFVRFARDDLKKFSDIYSFIRKSEEGINEGFEWLHYNAVRRYGFQPMVLLASVDVGDTTTVWRKKISLAARLIDLILTTRTIEGRVNNYDNLKDISFQLAKDMRGKSLADLEIYVRDEWKKYFPSVSALSNIKYARSDRSDMLYILSRVAEFLESNLNLTNKVGFSGYWQRDKDGKTFDIEHLLREVFDDDNLPDDHGFAGERDYKDARNSIGALVLLPRSRNRSLQDQPYRKKLGVYATENVLAQSLTENFFQNNPTVSAWVAEQEIHQFSPVLDFKKADIAGRGELYTSIARRIWDVPC